MSSSKNLKFIKLKWGKYSLFQANNDQIELSRTIIIIIYDFVRSVECTINILQSSYDDHLKWCLYFKCVIVFARVVNYAPGVINCAPRVMLQIVASLLLLSWWVQFVYSIGHKWLNLKRIIFGVSCFPDWLWRKKHN